MYGLQFLVYGRVKERRERDGMRKSLNSEVRQARIRILSLLLFIGEFLRRPNLREMNLSIHLMGVIMCLHHGVAMTKS